MDQVKIGKFIALKRKQAGLTQMQLAEQLGITDRAVSKWETGKAMPDASIMLALCQILQITVNDLLCGEVVTVENYNRELENNLLQAIREKELADKRMLAFEIVLGVVATAFYLALVCVLSFVSMERWLRITLFVGSFILFIAALSAALKIEQTAGYYACAKCGHRYVPSFKSVLLAPHVCRTRHMRCPNCHEKSWQKKVISRE